MNIAKKIACGIVVLSTGFSSALLAQASKQKVVAPTPFIKSPTGLLYKFHTNKDGVNAKSGDVIKMHFALSTEKDSLLRSTFKEGNPTEMPLRAGTFKGSLEEGLMMMSPGDSASFKISADSLFTKMFNSPLPPFLRPGSNVTFLIKLISTVNEEAFKLEQAKIAAEMVGKEDKTIQDFMTKNNMKGIKTASGLYYLQTLAGTGAKAESGKTVSVHYTGKLLDGSKFDSSVDRGQPFEFGLGQGQVIKGWDEGIALMSIGEKGTLLIPSPLGYGARGQGSIPPNAILLFEVELLGVK